MTNAIAQDILDMELETLDRCAVDLNFDGIYENILKGCYVKCFEFSVFSHKLEQNNHAYFAAPVLRGICEDFISLSYLKRKKTRIERNELLKNKMLSLVFDAANKQQAFFKKRREFQPTYSGALKTKPQTGKLPSTRDMAAAVALEDIYDFMYAVTSDIVHFNPRIIIRNAWGKDEKHFSHSVNNFDSYYTDFCRAYGIFFLCLFARAFQSDFSFSSSYMKAIGKLDAWLDEKLRWPEAVTFEEMNVEGPTEVMRILMKMAAQSSNRKDG